MKIKFVVLSQKVISGEQKFDLDKLAEIGHSFDVLIDGVSIVSKDNNALIEQNVVLFMEDDKIDDFVVNNKFFHENKAEIYEKVAIASFEKNVFILPIEADYISLYKSILTELKQRKSLSNILTIRLFKLTKDEILSRLNELDIKSDFTLWGSGLFSNIYLKNAESEGFLSEDEVKISQEFSENIYSQSALDFDEVLSKLLFVKPRKILIEDSFTGGLLAERIYSENLNLTCNIFKTINEGEFIKISGKDICYRNETEMVTKILEQNKQNYDLSICVASKNEKDGYMVTFSICKGGSLDIYNLNLSAEFKEAQKICCDFVLYNLIKKLKEKDFEN